ncbi:MAG TPA: amidohydrolase family protein [Anaerolineae bacterium]|nr:amidohydrolase family protein [Anaerolineae bacterium]
MAQPIVDTHVHLWDPNHISYPWLAGAPAINRPFVLEDFRAASAGLNVEKIVFMECDAAAEDGLKEAAWVSSLAREEPRIQGIIAFAPLERGEGVRGYLDQLVKDSLVKGVRRLIQSERPGFASQPDFVKGVQCLPAYNLSFDLCLRHYQLADTLKLVEQCPGVFFILDHIGKPDIKSQLFDPWRAEIKALARFSNTYCKISGLVTEADLENWTRQDLKPYIDHVIEVFGPDRIIYGGDWPVSTLATTYRTWVETLDWATEDLSDAERHKLFYENAISFYRLS